MAAPKGNEFWKQRSSHGRNPLFATPDDLWVACAEYFEWVEANPLWESKPFVYQGEVTIATFPKMRAMSLGALCIFLDVARTTWDDYRSREDYSSVTTRVEEIIYAQKFEGASAELLNPSIIARDLALADRSEVSGRGGAPVELITRIELVAPNK